MIVSGNLSIKVDDEQLDKIVVDHCNAAIATCIDVINLERQCIIRNPSGDTVHHIQNILDHQRYLDALRTVVEYFGGVIYKGDTSE